MRRAWIGGLMLACACGAGTGNADSGTGPLDVVFLHDAVGDTQTDPGLPDARHDLVDPGSIDPGPGDPGASDALPDVSTDAAPDPGEPLDPGSETGSPDPGPGDDGPQDPGASDPGAQDPGGIDPGPSDPGPSDPGPVDAGFDVTIGACAPGDTSCWCTADNHCNPAYNVACEPNVCDTATNHCHLDSHRLDGHACNDGDACTLGETCQAGACQGGTFTCQCHTAADCNDDNPCTDDACASGTCSNTANTAACDDGDACTANDTCRAGTCQGTLACQCRKDADCADASPCTQDACDLSTHTCTHAPVAGACDDGDPCTTPDTCSDGACVPGPDTCQCHVAADCPDPGNPCMDRACSVAHTCVPTANTAACDDGHACTTGDHCSGGACVPGAPTCAECGDGACYAAGEDCASCPADCGACPTTETSCGNGVDDDHDGLTDCLDPNCVGVSPCPSDSCSGAVVATLQCGATLAGNLNTLRKVSGSGCGDNFNNLYSSVFKLVAPKTGTLQVQVTHDDVSTDQFHAYVLSGICNPSVCAARACCFDPGLGTPMAAGASYFIVVEDSNPYTSGHYSVKVTCP